ncbi:MAG: histidine kinase [Mariniphaga sp.]|nr:histidine kinase [Mariniphaga sp.]
MADRILKLWEHIQYSKISRITLHVIFWGVVLIFNYLLFSWNDSNRNITLIISVSLMPLAIIVTYFFNYVLVPKYLWEKRYGRFFLFSFYTFLFSVWCSFLIVLFVLILGVNKYDYIDPTVLSPELQVITLNFIIFLAIAIKQVKRAFFMQQEKSQLEKAGLTTELKLKEAELKLLKAQIHPHFLFNTLNNLYGLTLEKSDDAPSLVLRLSEILDYILYRCEEKQVPLDEEIQNLKNYVEIEKIRYSEKLKLEFNSPEKINGLKIAPLVLLPFIENAFKHGVSNHPEAGDVFISFQLNNNVLEFKVSNSKPFVKIVEDKKGIGLENVKKRLELLYPGKFNLKIVNGKEIYSVTLIIELED